MGFSFNSNNLGLRGPMNISAPNVIMGTSFAMGFGVDIGCDWYNHLYESQEYFNLGLPIGFKQQSNLLESTLSDKDKDLLIYLYHPNIWSLSKRYELFDGNQSIFEIYKWKTDYYNCLKQGLKITVKNFRSKYAKELLEINYKNKKYLINSKYCSFPYECNVELFDRVCLQMKELSPR
jgi:hypothetical protein